MLSYATWSNDGPFIERVRARRLESFGGRGRLTSWGKLRTLSTLKPYQDLQSVDIPWRRYFSEKYGVPVVSADQPSSYGIEDHFWDAMNIEFLHEIATMCIHGVRTETQEFSNLLGGFQFRNELEQLTLSWRK